MPEGGITVRGIPEVQRNLAAFPQLLVMQCLLKAVSRAAAVIEEELAARTPEDEDARSTEEYGLLIENLMSVVTVDENGQGARASIGFGKKGFIALFVEYGHRLVRGGNQYGSVAPHPFMRAAFEAAAEKAVDVFIEEVRNYLTEGSIAA